MTCAKKVRDLDERDLKPSHPKKTLTIVSNSWNTNSTFYTETTSGQNNNSFIRDSFFQYQWNLDINGQLFSS